MSKREERIERARRKDLVRTALRSAATHGYYIFDELMTEEAGMIDFLAVGPVGACIVVVRDEPGQVTADVDGTLYLDGRRFEDDPKHQAADLEADVNRKLEGTGAQCYDIICFTRAELFYLGDDVYEVMRGVSPIWDLPLPFATAETEHTPADVAELADHIREVYGRPPFVVPEEENI
ncbi:MAG: nuclease-related domain-containing protein [Rubrobacteraceae bacterium]